MRALLADYSDDDDKAGTSGDEEVAADVAVTDNTTAKDTAISSQTRKRVNSTATLPSSTNTTSKKQRLSLPPPPLQLLSKPSSHTAHSTSSSSQIPTSSTLADGRIRTFPHVEGNWATHVYIAIPLTPALNELMDECDTLLPPHLAFTRHPLTTLHLSLSRCVTIRHHHIPHLVRLLTTAVASVQVSHVPVTVSLSALAVYGNEERSRSFAALRVCGGMGESELLSVLGAVNGVMREMGLQTFYEQPELHVTYAWRLGDVWQESESEANGEASSEQRSEKERELLSADVDEVTMYEDTCSDVRDTRFDRPTAGSCFVEVSAVHCKVGNKVTVIPLRAKR